MAYARRLAGIDPPQGPSKASPRNGPGAGVLGLYRSPARPRPRVIKGWPKAGQRLSLDRGTGTALRHLARVATYLTELHQAMQAVLGPALDEAVGLLLDARERGATVYFCGNGGSASASHWAST